MVGPLKCLLVNGTPFGAVFVRCLSGVLGRGKGYCPEHSCNGCTLVTLIPLLSKNS